MNYEGYNESKARRRPPSFILFSLDLMFPRTALAIAALLIAAIIAFFIRGAFEGQRMMCERNIAVPYEKLVSHMRKLAETGRIDELRALIIQVDERKDNVARVCRAAEEKDYVKDVYEWTR